MSSTEFDPLDLDADKTSFQPSPAEFGRKRALLMRMHDSAVLIGKQRRAVGANALRATFGHPDRAVFEGCGVVQIEVWQSGLIHVSLGTDRDPELRFESQKFVWDEAMLTDRMT